MSASKRVCPIHHYAYEVYQGCIDCHAMRAERAAKTRQKIVMEEDDTEVIYAPIPTLNQDSIDILLDYVSQQYFQLDDVDGD